MDDVIVNDQARTDDACAAQSQVGSLGHRLKCLGGGRGDMAEKRVHCLGINNATIQALLIEGLHGVAADELG